MVILSFVAVAPLLFGLARGHGVIVKAQGDSGPESVGFQVDPEVARNCITISPCQQDTTIIRDAEIKSNVVNQCGRTQLKGNIDVGENTENALAAGKVTQVQSGGSLQVTIHQVNADGAGPYFCDLDESSNSGIKFTNLTVTDNVPGSNGLSQNKTQAFDIHVQMPSDLNCAGGSTGNICTVRCRNNALAGPFGGCFPVQQSDTEEKSNTPARIKSASKMGAINSQVQQNQADFPTAVKANEKSGSGEAEQNRAAVEAILANSPVTKSFPQETPTVSNDNRNKGPGGNTGAGAPGNDGANVGDTGEADFEDDDDDGASDFSAPDGSRAGGGGERGGRGNSQPVPAQPLSVQARGLSEEDRSQQGRESSGVQNGNQRN